jgi:proteasome lid subunit RPN8/RPN11
MDPQEQLNLELRRDRTGESLFAIYHSHVASEARPSPTDERMAFFPPGDFSQEPSYPDTYYILISLVNPDEPSVRAFRIRKGDSYEERVVEEPDIV